MITISRLKELLFYDTDSGLFTRLVSVNHNARVGMRPGEITQDGYLRILIDGRKYLAHRLAWFYVYGCWPEKQIDHIDRNKLNNRINNLRDVSQSINQHNRTAARKDNKSTGLLGAYFAKRTGKYQALITVNGKLKGIGRYNSAEDAHKAYLDAKKELHSPILI